MPPIDQKRIAKNATMLYVRMFVFSVVSFYTSRVVLQTLGVSDYGIYNVVGGIVAILSLLNTSLSGSTSRFLAYEIGRGSAGRLSATFSSAVLIHIGLALLVFLLAESAGLYFLTYHLVIPSERMAAAHWVYQFSILATVVAILQTPYNACLIARERMNVYAYLELFSAGLKLLAVSLLPWLEGDKLILYALFIAAVSVLTSTIARLYCRRHYLESHFRFVWQPQFLRPMLSFSGWGMVQTSAVAIQMQGSNFLLNLFFGTVLNATNGVVTMVQGVLNALMYNLITAFRPQMIQKYAEGRLDALRQLMLRASIFSAAACLLFSIPLFFEAESAFALWLGEVPPYAPLFLRLTIVANLLSAQNFILSTVMEATGEVKRLRLFSSMVYLLLLPLLYVAYRCGGAPEWIYLLSIPGMLAIYAVNLCLLRRRLPELRWRAYLYELFRSQSLPAMVGCALAWSMHQMMGEGIARFFLLSIVSIAGYLGTFYLFSLSQAERSRVKAWMGERW